MKNLRQFRPITSTKNIFIDGGERFEVGDSAQHEKVEAYKNTNARLAQLEESILHDKEVSREEAVTLLTAVKGQEWDLSQEKFTHATLGLQAALKMVGIDLKVDGAMNINGGEMQGAIKQFATKYNRIHPDTQITEDGAPTPEVVNAMLLVLEESDENLTQSDSNSAPDTRYITTPRPEDISDLGQRQQAEIATEDLIPAVETEIEDTEQMVQEQNYELASLLLTIHPSDQAKERIAELTQGLGDQVDPVYKEAATTMGNPSLKNKFKFEARDRAQASLIPLALEKAKVELIKQVDTSPEFFRTYLDENNTNVRSGFVVGDQIILKNALFGGANNKAELSEAGADSAEGRLLNSLNRKERKSMAKQLNTWFEEEGKSLVQAKLDQIDEANTQAAAAVVAQDQEQLNQRLNEIPESSPEDMTEAATELQAANQNLSAIQATLLEPSDRLNSAKVALEALKEQEQSSAVKQEVRKLTGKIRDINNEIKGIQKQVKVAESEVKAAQDQVINLDKGAKEAQIRLEEAERINTRDNIENYGRSHPLSRLGDYFSQTEAEKSLKTARNGLKTAQNAALERARAYQPSSIIDTPSESDDLVS